MYCRNGRSRNYGVEEAGITEYEILAMHDERMCPICANMHGRVFSVPKARAKINSALEIEDPEAFKAAMPWLTTPPAGVSNESLEAAGMLLPPFHGRCRCTVVSTFTANSSISGALNDKNDPDGKRR